MLQKLSILLSALAALLLWAVACDDDGGGGSVPDGPAARIDENTGHCLPSELASLVPPAGTGGSIETRMLTGAEDGIGGPGALGRAGDVYVRVDDAEWVIQGPRTTANPGTYGGNPIDAGRVALSDEDVFGEIVPFFRLGLTFAAERIEILEDLLPGVGVIVATGPGATLDFFDVEGTFDLIGLEVQLPYGPDIPGGPESLTVSNIYLAVPGAPRLRMVTAICRAEDRGAEPLPMPVGDFMVAGGRLAPFVPGSMPGLGGSITPIDTPSLMQVGAEVTYGYVPPTATNASLGFGGATITLLEMDSASLFELLLRPSEEVPENLLLLPEGGGTWYWRDLVSSGGDIDQVREVAWSNRSLAVGTVSGSLSGGGAGARVALIDLESGELHTRGVLSPDGSFELHALAGRYQVLVDDPAAGRAQSTELTVSAGMATDAGALSLPEAATLRVVVADPDGSALPARVTVLCGESGCPAPAHPAFASDPRDSLGPDVQAVRYAPADGVLEMQLPAGDVRVVVSRGPTHSVWPSLEGEAVQLRAGELTEVNAEIAQVVDTSGYLSGDFHVHSGASFDSGVLAKERVSSFIAEGLDVMVSTEHDRVFDLAPALTEVGGDAFANTIVGLETTTYLMGHFNSFPQAVDAATPDGGAFDWTGAQGPSMTPQQLADAALDGNPDRILQINHPRFGFAYFDGIRIDTRDLSTARDPLELGMPPGPAGQADTGLFEPRFNAIEVLNGATVTDRTAVMNDWFALLNLGVRMTATAVSDTHVLYDLAVGSARTFVRVEGDSAATFDEGEFISATKAGRAFGTYGPFLRVSARNVADETASYGETLSLAAAGETVSVDVRIEAPEWMDFDTLMLFTNTPGVAVPSGMANSTEPTPQQTQTLDLSEIEPEAGASGHAAHRRRVIEHSFELTPARDAWVVLALRGPDDDEGAFFPALGRETTIYALTNPIFIDADGGGWDDFPGASASQQALRAAPRASRRVRKGVGGAPLTREDLDRMFWALEALDH